MNSISLLWNLLKFKGGLPDELITIILYKYNGFTHPIAKLLLCKTQINIYEALQYRPFIPNLLLEYNRTGYTNSLQNKLINEQKNYSNLIGYYIRNYIIYRDIGYFIPRKFGNLFYEINDDYFSIPLKNWKLHRSKKILKKIKCICDYSYWDVNKYILLERFNYNYSHILQHLEKEKNFILNSYVCQTCINIIFY